MNYGKELAVEGVLAIELAEGVERLIISRGAKCAFPVNICLNHVAAHYTPQEGDSLSLSRGDIVKIDVGAQVDGCIADTAASVEIATSNWADLIRASQEGLNCALEMLAPDVPVGSIGAAVEAAVKGCGFEPIKNLTGHSMERGKLHAGLTIPNVAAGDRRAVRAGTAVAIEPFATTGKGQVDGGKGGNIYSVIARKRLSDEEANAFLQRVVDEFTHLPFAARWCSGFSEGYRALIRKHWRHRNLMSYPILSEVSSGMVSQAEHSALVLDDSVIVYTR